MLIVRVSNQLIPVWFILLKNLNIIEMPLYIIIIIIFNLLLELPFPVV